MGAVAISDGLSLWRPQYHTISPVFMKNFHGSSDICPMGFIYSIKICEISHQTFGPSHRKCPTCPMIFVNTVSRLQMTLLISCLARIFRPSPLHLHTFRHICIAFWCRISFRKHFKSTPNDRQDRHIFDRVMIMTSQCRYMRALSQSHIAKHCWWRHWPADSLLPCRYNGRHVVKSHWQKHKNYVRMEAISSQLYQHLVLHKGAHG